MYVICEDNSGFEDQLTQGSVYQVEDIGQGSYRVYDDKEQARWYGSSKFAVVKEAAL